MRRRLGLRDLLGAAAILAALAGTALLLRSEQVDGSAYVIDGDTLTVAGRRVRLQGLDAPELGQSCERDGAPYRCGEDAKRALVGLVNGQPVACRLAGQDRYRRALGTCRADGRDLGESLVRRGWAVSYGGYEREERDARQARAGLWAGRFERPDEWRRQHASGPRPLAAGEP